MSNRDEAGRLAEQGRHAAQSGVADQALALYDQALALLDGSRDELSVSILRWKGTALAEIGQTRRAIDFYRQSINLANDLGDRSGSAEGLNALATIAMRRGALNEADALYKDAARLAAE